MVSTRTERSQLLAGRPSEDDVCVDLSEAHRSVDWLMERTCLKPCEIGSVGIPFGPDPSGPMGTSDPRPMRCDRSVGRVTLDSGHIGGRLGTPLEIELGEDRADVVL